MGSDHAGVVATKPRPPLPIVLAAYLRKYLGLDMALKTICYAMRLRMVWSADAAHRDWLQILVLNIVDCRMLCNSMKHIFTFISAYRAARTPLKNTEFQTLVAKLCTVLSFFFRTFEQLFGDLGYLQKNVFGHWSRDYLSRNYKKYKTFALVCNAILEAMKLYPSFRRVVAPVIGESERRLRHLRTFSSDTNQAAFFADAKGVAWTPVVNGASRFFPGWKSPLASPPPDPLTVAAAAGAGNAFTVVAPRRQAEAALTPSIAERMQDPTLRSALFLTRNVADIIVYGQWVSWYNPPKTLEYCCGILSGALGVFIVWADTEAELRDCRSKE